jgi:hypothetical protein
VRLLSRHVLLNIDLLFETSVAAANDFRDRRRKPVPPVGSVEEEPMALSLTSELLKHQHLQETLRSEFPEADGETLEDTLEGLTELSEMMRPCCARTCRTLP